jgi:hypothetical protein
MEIEKKKKRRKRLTYPPQLPKQASTVAQQQPTNEAQPKTEANPTRCTDLIRGKNRIPSSSSSSTRPTPQRPPSPPPMLTARAPLTARGLVLILHAFILILFASRFAPASHTGIVGISPSSSLS